MQNKFICKVKLALLLITDKSLKTFLQQLIRISKHQKNKYSPRCSCHWLTFKIVSNLG